MIRGWQVSVGREVDVRHNIVQRFTGLVEVVPGVFLAALIVAGAASLQTLPGLFFLSIPILSVILGIGFSQLVGRMANAKAGILLCQRSLLRFAVVLLGFQLTFEKVLSIGTTGLAIAGIVVVSTFVLTSLLGRWLGVEAKLAQLIAAGTSICGASAIVATHSTIRSTDEDVAYAVASITLFGTIAMFLFPLLYASLPISEAQFGLWAGSAIHEVAQVVGAGMQVGDEAGRTAIIAKLSRVMLLAPLVLSLGLVMRRAHAGEAGGQIPVPWFILAFVSVVTLNSSIDLPPEFARIAGMLSTFLLSMGLAAMGLHANIAELRKKGTRPLLLAFVSTIFVSCGCLALVKAMT